MFIAAIASFVKAAMGTNLKMNLMQTEQTSSSSAMFATRNVDVTVLEKACLYQQLI